MLAYARLAPGPGFRPARAALYYAQRMAVQPQLRRLVARAIAAGVRLSRPRPRPRQRLGAGVAENQLDRGVDRLQHDGLAMLPATAPQRIARIRDYLRTMPVAAPGGGTVAWDALPAGTPAAAYPLATVLRCPEVCDLVNDPTVLSLATRYLGCVPTLSSIGIRWSLPGREPASDVQRFHRDVDDWRFLKLFVYLTDVDDAGGPHVYVTGSHRTAGRLRARPYERRDIARQYGAECIRAITGPAGTTFLADTYGIHRGSVPEHAPRLILQAQYSLLPIFAFDYAPVASREVAALDPYVNRLLLKPSG